MRTNIKSRVLDECDYILSNKTTLRNTAKYFGVSKSTVHKDFLERLFTISPDKYNKVITLLEYNLSVRHLRGGNSTRQKWASKNN